MRKTILFVVIFFSLINNSGCVYRRLTIESSPPGATVYFDEKEIGTTPVEFDFMYYANHKIRLEKEGYQTVETRGRIKCPPQLWIPFDLIAEILPIRVEDYRELSYKLNPKPVEEGTIE